MLQLESTVSLNFKNFQIISSYLRMIDVTFGAECSFPTGFIQSKLNGFIRLFRRLIIIFSFNTLWHSYCIAHLLH